MPSGEELARQSGGLVVWKHQSPTGATRNETSATPFIGRFELDPTGATVGLTGPPLPDTHGGEGDIPSSSGGTMDGRFSSISGPADDCQWDGVWAPCDMAVRALNMGAADLGSFTIVQTKSRRGAPHIFAGNTPLPAGLDMTFTGGRAAVADAWFDYHMPNF